LWYNRLVANGNRQLVRAIGRWTLAALMVNLIIGGGIFELPSSVAGMLGSQSPIAYLIAAGGMGIIAACIAEVASRFQQASGPYLWARTAFGRFFGLQTGWLLWLTRVSAAAAVANVFVDYLLGFWPQATGPSARLVILTILIGGLAVINIRGVKIGTGVSNFFTLAKLLPLIILVVGGLLFIKAHGSVVRPQAESHSPGTWAEAVLLLVFAYGGFEAALIPASEVENPARDAPIALMAALIIVTILYFLVQTVVVHLLADPGRTDLPLSAAANVFGGNATAAIVSAGALLSSLGFFAANMIVTPRITFAFAEQGDFPRWFAAIHRRYQTPYISILSFAVLVWLLAVMGTFRWNAALSAISRLFVYVVACAALPTLRKKSPVQEGFRLPGGPWLTVLGIAFALALVSRMGVAELGALAITTVVSFLNWLVVRGKTPLAQ
jgi:APA family basic amino acid/polyamine antiporter